MSKKILDCNVAGLLDRDLMPGAQIDIDKSFMAQIHIKECKNDGFYVEVDSHPPLKLGSEYSEEKIVNRQISKCQDIEIMTYCYTLGFDTGYYIKRLLDTLPKSAHLLVVEPWPELFYKMCMYKDFSELFMDKRLTIFLEKDLQKIVESSVESGPLSLISLYKKSKYLERPQSYLLPEFDSEAWRKVIERKFIEVVNYNIFSFQTVDVSIKNYFDNARQSLDCQDWKTLIEAFKDQPLVLVGMGPSLAHGVEKLKKIQEKCYIGCVDNALRELLHQGIKPDFVFAVEWQGVSLEFYKNLDIPDETILVFLPGVCPDLLNYWKGPKISYPAIQLLTFWGDLVDRTCNIFMGTNVGMLAVQFAMGVHSQKVYLVGFDFCAPMANYNHPNSAYVWNIYPDMTRFSSVEKTDYLYLKNHALCKESIGMNGENVYTLQSMDDGRLQISEIFKNLEIKDVFYNCSKYGVQIEGVDFKDLNELLKESQLFEDKKNLHIETRGIEESEFNGICRQKIKQVKKYYQALDELNLLAEDFRKAMDEQVSEKRYSMMIGEFYKKISSLQNDKELSWIEVSMVEMDRRLRHLVKMEQVSREDATDEKEKMRQMMTFFQEQYKILRSYKKFFIQFLESHCHA